MKHRGLWIPGEHAALALCVCGWQRVVEVERPAQPEAVDAVLVEHEAASDG